MTFVRRLFALLTMFSIATVVAEAGLLVALWKRGTLSEQTAEILLTVAYDVPVQDIYARLVAKAQPVKKEMVSFAEVQEARTLASLDLDLREVSCEKGLLDLRELEVLLDQEKGRYTQIKDRFDLEWSNLEKGASDSSLRDLQRQIETMQPKAAKDQLLRILDSPDLPSDLALNQVVTIFKAMALDKRKKIVAEFKEADAPRLQEILKQIRLGMPEVDLIRSTRTSLQEFQTE